MRTLILAILFQFAIHAHADPLIVIYPKGLSAIDTRRAEVVELIRAALEKTRTEYGEFILQPSSYAANPLRLVPEIKSNKPGHINLAWIDFNETIEKELNPIYIPIQKGIVGYRVFLIRKEAKDKFKSQMSLEDLRQLTNGIGIGWMDIDIFKLNQMNHVLGTNYEGLFKMLDKNRFDYFSRGINEAFSELEQRRARYPDLRVEQNIALHYTHPIYLFTSKENTRLHSRLKKGLNQIIADGSFDRIFCKYNKTAIDKADLKNRKIFRLKYHLTPPNSVYTRKELWFDPQKNICQ